jgi:hypothetical protein
MTTHPAETNDNTTRYAWGEDEVIFHWPNGVVPPSDARRFPHTWFGPSMGRRVAVNCPADYIVPAEGTTDPHVPDAT